jgi:hypothetical protein
MSEIIVNERDSEVFENMTGEKLGARFSTKGDYQDDAALLKKVHRELEKQPLASEACADFAQAIENEQREDLTLPFNEFRVNDFGMLVRKDGGEIAEGLDFLDPLPQAWTQLCQRAPAGVETKLRSNVNSWLHRKTSNMVARTFQPMDVERKAFAVVTEKYQPHDANEIAEEIARSIPAGARGTVQYAGDGGRFEINAALGRPFDADGDLHQIIITVRSSDNGTLGQSVYFKAHRLKCTNGIYVAKKSLICNARHRGARNTLQDQFTKGLAMATAAMNSFQSLWTNARSAKFLCAQTGDPINGPEALSRLAMHKKLAVPHIRPKALLECLMGAYDKEPGSSVADVINAATRTAHESVDHFRSQWFGNDLEEQAGVLLNSGNYTLSPLTEEQREKLED